MDDRHFIPAITETEAAEVKEQRLSIKPFAQYAQTFTTTKPFYNPYSDNEYDSGTVSENSKPDSTAS